MVSKSGPSAPSLSGLPLPSHIGRYDVIDRVATGGMAEVFVACEKTGRGLERLVVVKRILPHLAMHDTFVQMFLAEARWVARIQHPNVVQIYELGEDADGLPFLSMEYVPGSSFRDLLSAAQDVHVLTPVGAAIALLTQACAGAHAAHELRDLEGHPLGLVHRDISPHNLMVTATGHVKLLDFGIAKATEAGVLDDSTRTGALKGKLHYMAPEQIKQEQLDRRADVFALGVVAWEFLAQERLFKRESELEAMQAIVAGNIKDLRARRFDVPEAVISVIEKALAPARDARWQTADEFRRALLEASESAFVRCDSDAAAAFVEPLLGEAQQSRLRSLLQAAEEHAVEEQTEALGLPVEDHTVVDKPNVGDTRPPPHVDAEPTRRDGVRTRPRNSPRRSSSDEPVADPLTASTSTHAGQRAASTMTSTKASTSAAPRLATASVAPTDLATAHKSAPLAKPPTRSRRRQRAAALVALVLACAAGLAFQVVRLRSRPTGEPLVLSWAPTVDLAVLREELDPLKEMLEELTGRPVEIRIPSSYAAVVDDLVQNRAAFAAMPPYLFLEAQQKYPDLEPLATKLVDGSSGSDGILLVAEQSSIGSIAELKGHRFCFTNTASTTGYLLPRSSMRQAGIDPDVDIEPHFSGNHSQVIRDLASGVCDAAATHSGNLLSSARAGLPLAHARVLGVTGRSPEDIIVAWPTTSEADRALFKKALLAVDPERFFARDVLGATERVSGFSEPRLEEFEAVRAAAKEEAGRGRSLPPRK